MSEIFIKLNGRMCNLVFILLLVLTFAVISIAYKLGINQDRSYVNNYNLYKSAMDLIGQQNYSQALPLLEELDEDSSENYQILYMKAICVAQQGDYATAIDYMQAAREAWPALIQDQTFLFRYGVMLYNQGDYQKAQLYLEQSLKYPDNTGYVQEAGNYLAAISDK